MAVKYFTGFETGSATLEVTSTLGTITADPTTVRTGAYSLKCVGTGATQSAVAITLPSASAYYSRSYIYVHVTTIPSLADDRAAISFHSTTGLNGTFVGQAVVFIHTDGTTTFLYEDINGAQVGSEVSLTQDTWHLVELDITAISATVGVVVLNLDGVTIASSSTVNTGVANIVSAKYRAYYPNGGASINIFHDDICISDSAEPGPGQCIARQGLAGTPTYDTFTKVGLGTAALNWSETPFSGTNACTSSTNGGAQTMLTASFSAAQSGHGIQLIKELDVINACKTVVIAKIATGSSHSIRRRLNGVDTDTAKTLTTSDAYYYDGIWTDTVTNLNASEIGMLHGPDTNLLTVEDVWLMVDYTGARRWFIGAHR